MGLSVLSQDIADGVLKLIVVVDDRLLLRILVVKHALLAVLVLANKLRLPHLELLALLIDHLGESLLVLQVVG
jgi:hypothetical protein